MNIYRKDDIQLMSFMGQIVFKDDFWMLKDSDGMLDVRARAYVEAVDETGAILGSGDYFSLWVAKGQKFTIRNIEPPVKEFSAAQIKKARSTKTINVVAQERYDSGPFVFDSSLDKVISSLQKIRNKIPEQFREKAHCEIDSESGYEGSHYARIEVAYDRPETDEEVVHRLQQESVAKALHERKERDQLENLKKKYQASA